MNRWGPKHVELTYVMNKTQSLKNFLYLVGLHVYYKMIHGPYNIKLILSQFNLKSHAIFFKKRFYIFLQILLRLFKGALPFIFVSWRSFYFSCHPMYTTYPSHFFSSNLMTLMLFSWEARIVRAIK